MVEFNNGRGLWEFGHGIRFWKYVRENGTEIGDCKCLFCQEKNCDMKCPVLQVKLLQVKGDKLTISFLCTKFDPPMEMRTTEI